MMSSVMLPPEFNDVVKVIEMGAVKHGMDSWLQPDIFTAKRTQSQFRHLLKKTGLWNSLDGGIQSAIGVILTELGKIELRSTDRLDKESQLPHELHEACNALMFYTVIERGILKLK